MYRDNYSFHFSIGLYDKNRLFKTEVFVLETIEERVKERLVKYLGRDDTGIRKEILKMLLNVGTFTTGDVFEYLKKTDFMISYRGVSAIEPAAQLVLPIFLYLRGLKVSF